MDAGILITAMSWIYFPYLLKDCNNGQSQNDRKNSALSPFGLSVAQCYNLFTTYDELMIKEKPNPIKSRGAYSELCMDWK